MGRSLRVFQGTNYVMRAVLVGWSTYFIAFVNCSTVLDTLGVIKGQDRMRESLQSC